MKESIAQEIEEKAGYNQAGEISRILAMLRLTFTSAMITNPSDLNYALEACRGVLNIISGKVKSETIKKINEKIYFIENELPKANELYTNESDGNRYFRNTQERINLKKEIENLWRRLEKIQDKYGYGMDALFWKVSYGGLIHKKPDGLISFIADHPDYRDLQDAYNWLAKTYKRRNEIDKAVQVYKEAVGKFKGDAYFLNHVGWWIFENKIEGEYAAAITYAEEAITLQPEMSAFWDTLAQLYNVNGERQKAINASERALRLAPENQREEYQGYLDKIRDGK